VAASVAILRLYVAPLIGTRETAGRKLQMWWGILKHLGVIAVVVGTTLTATIGTFRSTAGDIW
jgi:hypothetical protein